MNTMHIVIGLVPQHAYPRRSTTLLCGLLLASSGLVLQQGTTLAFAQEKTHVMPKGDTMKGPPHLKSDSTGMSTGAHQMPKGGIMGAKIPGTVSTAPGIYEKRAADSTATGIGTTRQTGPFQITLIGAPKTGKTLFEVRVTRDGQPVPDAKVALNLSMPYHKHGAMVGRLDDMGLVSGQYAGTVRTPMSGIYDARVLVSAGGDKGTSTYRFNTNSEPYVAHLGMWHPAGGFEVRLTNVSGSNISQSGDNPFRVQVTRDGYAVTDADVTMALTMPSMSRMGSAESSVKLTPISGAYEGSGKLLHSGGWRGLITVRMAGAKGSATYDFPAVNK